MLRWIKELLGLDVRRRIAWNPYQLGTLTTPYYPVGLAMKVWNRPEDAIGRKFTDKDGNTWKVESWLPAKHGSDVDEDDGTLTAVRELSNAKMEM